MYLDPGFGSMMIQAVVAAIAAVAVGFGIFRHRIMNFFKRNKDQSEEIEIDESSEESDVE